MATQSAPQIPVASCQTLLDSALAHCATAAPPDVPTSPTGSPELANSFAALSMAIGWGAFVVAIAAVVAGVSWAFFVRHWAREEARKEIQAKLKDMADDMCKAWLSENVPKMFREYAKMVSAGGTGGQGPAFDADAIAENVDDEPKPV